MSDKIFSRCTCGASVLSKFAKTPDAPCSKRGNKDPNYFLSFSSNCNLAPFFLDVGKWEARWDFPGKHSKAQIIVKYCHLRFKIIVVKIFWHFCSFSKCTTICWQRKQRKFHHFYRFFKIKLHQPLKNYQCWKLIKPDLKRQGFQNQSPNPRLGQ